MVKLGWLLTAYLGLSLVLFFAASFTLGGWIVYLVMLLPVYGLVFLGGWIWVWQNRTKTARVRWWIWSVVLVLQIATILASPGNCYGIKQGDRCYSNLQILAGNVSRTGRNIAPHWEFVEDAFPGLVIAYDVAVVVGVLGISVD